MQHHNTPGNPEQAAQQDAFCGVPLPNLVYIGPGTREEFDRINLPATVHGWLPDDFHTRMQRDGRAYERRCTSKTLGELGNRDGVAVIFQWFDFRVAESPPAVALAAGEGEA